MQIASNYAFLFRKKKKEKNFWDPLKRLMDTNGHDMAARTSVCLY